MNSKPETAAVVVLVKWLDRLTRGCLYLSALALSLLLSAYVFEVVARYFFDVPTSWSYDLSTWCLSVCIMASLPDVTRRKADITIDFMLAYLPPKGKRIFRKSIFLVSGLFCLAVAAICLGETWRQYRMGIETNWIDPIPKWWISTILPVGFSLCGLQFLRSAAEKTKTVP